VLFGHFKFSSGRALGCAGRSTFLRDCWTRLPFSVPIDPIGWGLLACVACRRTGGTVRWDFRCPASILALKQGFCGRVLDSVPDSLIAWCLGSCDSPDFNDAPIDKLFFLESLFRGTLTNHQYCGRVSIFWKRATYNPQALGGEPEIARKERYPGTPKKENIGCSFYRGVYLVFRRDTTLRRIISGKLR